MGQSTYQVQVIQQRLVVCKRARGGYRRRHSVQKRNHGKGNSKVPFPEMQNVVENVVDRTD